MVKIRKDADCLLVECEDFSEAAEGHRLSGSNKTEAERLVKRVSEVIAPLLEQDMYADRIRILDLRKFRSAIRRKLIDAEDVPPPVSPPAVIYNSPPARNTPAPNALIGTLAKQQVTFELSRLASTAMPNVHPSADVNPEEDTTRGGIG